MNHEKHNDPGDTGVAAQSKSDATSNTPKSTPARKPRPDYASALDCVMACGTRWCPFECPKLGGAA